MPSFSDSFRQFRRRLKSKLPYVRRREYRLVQNKYASIMADLAWKVLPATHAAIHILKPISPTLLGDVCFFVTFAPKPELKAHVKHHIECLLAEGVQVVLVVNTNLSLQDFPVEAALVERLSGVLIRENAGFDFAAWSHVYTHAENSSQWSRLFLINDSIVGPLNSAHFSQLIAKIRASSADLIGLTENYTGHRHLQSFFLVFNRTALQSEIVQQMLNRILSFVDKSQVIDVYETRLTKTMEDHGFRCEAMFAPLAPDAACTNDTYYRWSALLDAGFPYIKTSIIREQPNHPKVLSIVPHEFQGDKC